MTGPAAPARSRADVVLFTASYEMRGMEEHILQLAAGLVERGYRVVAVCDDRNAVWALRKGMLDAGVAVDAIPEREGARMGAAKRFRALVGALRPHRGALLHTHYATHRGGDLSLAAARVAGLKRLVRTEHNPPILPVKRTDGIHVRLRDRFHAGVICPSEHTRQAYLDHLGRDPERLVVIPHGIDLNRFTTTVSADAVRAELGFDRSGVVVGTVSSLSEERKGVGDFLTMARAVADRRPDVGFLVVGDGALRPELERQAAHLGLSDNVVFAGQRPDVPQLLAAMDVFVMPSHFEAGPYTLLEAMAAGRPVVTTPVGVAPTVVRHGQSGMIAPIGQPAALACEVVHLLADPERAAQVASTGREAVGSQYSIDAMVDATAALYEAVGV